MPKQVKRSIGYGLYQAQKGNKYKNAKALKGFGSARVIEIIDQDDAGTYRAVYTVQMEEVIFVLHVFKKKSNQGIKTPQKDVDCIRSRLKRAYEIYKVEFK